jgi:hypothetical protein
VTTALEGRYSRASFLRRTSRRLRRLGRCEVSAVAACGEPTRSQLLGLSFVAAAACQYQSDEAPERAQEGQVLVLFRGAEL